MFFFNILFIVKGLKVKIQTNPGEALFEFFIKKKKKEKN